MKQFITVLIITLTAFLPVNYIYAKSNALPDIVAIVNETPITKHDLEARKKMLIIVNDLKKVDAKLDKKLNTAAIDSLINDTVLIQHAQNVGGDISEEDIDNAISSVESNGNMKQGHLLKKLANIAIINSFKMQIEAELVKSNIISAMSKAVNVTHKETNEIILLNNSKDAKISAHLIYSNDDTHESFNKMKNLRPKLNTCSTIKESMYENFANNISINENLSMLTPQLHIIAKDLESDQVSNVFKLDNSFNILIMCDKYIDNISEKENAYITNFLNNKKLSQKIQQFINDLHKKAYIKVML